MICGSVKLRTNDMWWKAVCSVIIGAFACTNAFAAPFKNADDQARVELLAMLDADLGTVSIAKEELDALGMFDQEIDAKLEEHATQLLDDANKVEVILGFMLSKRIVLRDGRAASVAYHDAMKNALHGDLRLSTGMLDGWRRARPRSATPIILIASNKLEVAAENKREELFSNLEPDSQIPNEKNLGDVRKYLLAHKSPGSLDPYWYNLMVEVAILMHRDEEEIRELVREGLAAFPENIQLAVLASSRFLSKRGSEPMAFFEYAGWAFDLSELRNRPDVYPRIYGHAMRSQYGLTLFKLVPKDWALMRSGIEKLLSSFPDMRNRSLAGALACLGGDRELTRLILHDYSFRPDAEYWSTPGSLDVCSHWSQ